VNSSKIGSVTHYYNKIKVAIIDLSSNLKVGDKIKFVRGGEDLFTQNVDSIQLEHKYIDSASSGDVIGLRVENEVKEGAEVYKIE
jgi:translation elongation factor EF-1alpha